MSAITYQLGGSLPFNAPSYVTRSSDQELYELLMAGQFCYVFNSRQTGKSSLRVRLMQRLQAENIACADIDLSAIGTYQVTPQQWYGSLIQNLVSQLGLWKDYDQQIWRDYFQTLSPVACFMQFIETVLLQAVARPVVIFIDEIDSILQLGFRDDFFALIRACYNKRADHPIYQHLTFVLLGVTTPADLIGSNPISSPKTPFNISYPVELQGFHLSEVQPLINGLVETASNPAAVLRAILFWTSGQPFLTQKICQLACNTIDFIPEGQEEQYIETLVRSQVIENWESQDNPQHLKTIRDHLLQQGKKSARLLGLYQQVLEKGSISASADPVEMELQLSGLVVKKENQLKVYNPIYELVFDQRWLNKTLSNMTTYVESVEQWDYYSSIGDVERRIYFVNHDSAEVAITIQAFDTEFVGINKILRSIYGKVEFEYKVTSSCTVYPNIYFYIIPMQVTVRDQIGLIEVGADVQDDPKNSTSQFREQLEVPREHYCSNQWHQAGISYDFRKTPKAFYSIFAPRINEGSESPASAHLLIKGVRVFSFE